LKKNVRLGELRREHNDMLCSKMFLQLLFGIEEEKEEEEDFNQLLFMFHKILRMLYLICADIDTINSSNFKL